MRRTRQSAKKQAKQAEEEPKHEDQESIQPEEPKQIDDELEQVGEEHKEAEIDNSDDKIELTPVDVAISDTDSIQEMIVSAVQTSSEVSSSVTVGDTPVSFDAKLALSDSADVVSSSNENWKFLLDIDSNKPLEHDLGIEDSEGVVILDSTVGYKMGDSVITILDDFDMPEPEVQTIAEDLPAKEKANSDSLQNGDQVIAETNVASAIIVEEVDSKITEDISSIPKRELKVSVSNILEQGYFDTKLENVVSDPKVVVEQGDSDFKEVVEQSDSDSKVVVDQSDSDSKVVVEHSDSGTKVVEQPGSKVVVEQSDTDPKIVVEQEGFVMEKVVEQGDSDSKIAVEQTDFVSKDVESSSNLNNLLIGKEDDTKLCHSQEISQLVTEKNALDEFISNVQDTENVSDDDLPGPKPMELPEDTEVVSEDELPPTLKKNNTGVVEFSNDIAVKDAENVSDDELPGPKVMETTDIKGMSLDHSKGDAGLLSAPKRKRSNTGEDASLGTIRDESLKKKQALSITTEIKPQSLEQSNKSIQDAENVSDDELPGPKPMELLADTEVVSEDELPTPAKKEKEENDSSSRKRKHNDKNDSANASLDESANKKQSVSKSAEPKSQTTEKSEDKGAKAANEKPPSLPDLPKYWKAVTDDPTDFTGWTYLLQYVDVENDVDAARQAYDAFLSHYPYCYGYWRKYADYEKRKKAGSKKRCLEVLERGLKAIPLSVDLWLHYLNHIKNTNSDDHDLIHQQFERGISACGMEFRSDRLWELYIKWENEFGSPAKVTALYDRLLAMPTLGYSSHFSNFQEHIMSHGANTVVSIEEFVKLRAEVRRDAPAPVTLDADVPPGEDEADDHLRSEEEGNAIKELIIAARRKIHKQTAEEVSLRWTFEEGIKRPYFHVKPLEKCQLKNWKAYIEWEKERGGVQRTLVLFERCLIACALYEDYWQRYIDYLQDLCETDSSRVETTRDALQRACTVHHPDSPSLHCNWASFEEMHGNESKSADILDKLYKKFPNLLDVAFARAELERRRGNYDQVCTLYEEYITSAKSKWISSALAVKYARFLHLVRQDNDKALKILSNAIATDPLCERLYLQQVDIALHGKEPNVDEIVKYFDPIINNESAKYSSRLAFSTRKIELLESLGTSLTKVKAVEKEQRTLVRASRKARRKSGATDGDTPPGGQMVSDTKQGDKKTSGSGDPPSAQQASYAYGGGYTTAPPQYGHQVPYDANAAYQQQPYNSWGQYHQQPPSAYPPNPWQYRNYY